MKFMDNKRSQLNPDTLVRKLNNATTNYEDYVLAGQFFSVGVNYDNISGEGENFQKQNFGVAMETGLTNDVPHAVFLFVRSKQTLVMNENGVQVIV
jgi:hypothetical protein